MNTLRHLDLFSGIGGFALAARMVGGIQTHQFVEIEPFCQQCLIKNFPGVPIHDDITTFTARSGEYDLITFGSPCQDFSIGNPNGRGLEGERSGLFYEAIRLLRVVRPRYAVFENVSNVLYKDGGQQFQQILWAFYESGYDAEWQTISAASVGAPHLRERIFIVAYSDSQRCHNGRNNRQGRSIYHDIHRQIETPSQEWGELQSITGSMGETDANDDWNGFTLPGGASEWDSWGIESSVLRMDDGFSAGMDGTLTNPSWNNPSPPPVAQDIPNRVPRIKALGNSVVPQCAAIALKRVLELEAQYFQKRPEPLHRKTR